MHKSQRGDSSPGILGWIIILAVVAGMLGVGPCADSCYCGGPKLPTQDSK